MEPVPTHPDGASSRRKLLAAGGTGALALALAACGSSTPKPTLGGSNPNTGAGLGTDQFGKGDVGILGYLLVLEYLESAFYAGALASGKLSGQALTFARTFGAQESQHVAALESEIRSLGGSPPTRPATLFTFTDQPSILQVASTLENLGADAYTDQLARISSRAVLASVLSIHSVEGRHAAAIDSLTGTDVAFDGAFAKPAVAADVLQQITVYARS